tara:strand:+ start:81 stop:452 length:372 start_codon:yes stop_codon:yes gene_type:complete
MRKITYDSVKAFLNENQFKRGNTEVKVTYIDNNFDSNAPYEPVTVITDLLLHGNIIATATKKAINNKYETTITMTSAGWNTVTTKERLNGLLQFLNAGSIYQKDFQWFYNEHSWNGDEIAIYS